MSAKDLDLRVEVNNIQDKYPLSEILHQTLVVNCSDMSSMTFKEAQQLPIKSRPTARKSTNSKLKVSSQNSELQVVNLNHEQQNEANSPTSAVETLSNSCNLVCSDIDDNVPLKSIISSGNKIIITKATTSNGNDPPLPQLDNDNRNSSPDINNIDSPENAEALIEKIDSIIANQASHSSNSDDKSNESDDSGCATNASSNDPNPEPSFKVKLQLPTSKESEETKPPIKLVVSNIHDSPIIQKSAESYAKKTNYSQSLVKAPMPIETSVTQTATVTSCTPTMVVDLKLKSLPKKSKIDDIVDSLNLKNSKLCPTSTSSGAQKRSIDNCLLTPDSSPKKPKLVESEDDEMVTDTSILPSCKFESITNNCEVLKQKLDVGTSTCFAKAIYTQAEMEKYFHDFCENEFNLRMKLHLESEKYSKLKEKYESLEETFRSWMKFANDLQARVKKLAMHLHKQHDTVKTMHSYHSVPKVSVFVQTDKELLEKAVKIHYPKPTLNTLAPKQPSPNKNPSLSRLKSPTTPKAKPNSGPMSVPKHQSDVIDLTDDAENAASKRVVETASINREMQRILHLQNSKKSSLSPTGNVLKNQTQTLTSMSSLHGLNKPRASSTLRPHTTTGSVGFGNQQIHSQGMRAALNSTQSLNSLRMVVGRFQNVQQATTVQNMRQPVPRLQRSQSAMPNASRPILPQMPPYPPLPNAPAYGKFPRGALDPPPELKLGIKKANGGIVLSWNNVKLDAISAKVVGYELFAYHQATGNEKKEWKKIGDDTIAAMDLPMACTLSHFSNSSTYYFAVRGKDVYGRYGPFSKPCNSKEFT